MGTTGADVLVTSDFETCLQADGLVVPGVGAFGNCMNGLRAVRGDELLRLRFVKERATLGICIGMQVLFASSAEDKDVDGVALLPGRIERISAMIVPHMGWNRVQAQPQSRLFAGVEGERFYFVHSYALKGSAIGEIGSREGGRVATCEYGEQFVAAFEYGSLAATQFHPEKSGEAGLHLLDNWVKSL